MIAVRWWERAPSYDVFVNDLSNGIYSWGWSRYRDVRSWVKATSRQRETVANTDKIFSSPMASSSRAILLVSLSHNAHPPAFALTPTSLSTHTTPCILSPRPSPLTYATARVSHPPALARSHSPGRFIRRETFYVVYIKGNISTSFPLKRITPN